MYSGTKMLFPHSPLSVALSCCRRPLLFLFFPLGGNRAKDGGGGGGGGESLAVQQYLDLEEGGRDPAAPAERETN